jgi:hypothetical protein
LSRLIAWSVLQNTHRGTLGLRAKPGTIEPWVLFAIFASCGKGVIRYSCHVALGLQGTYRY